MAARLSSDVEQAVNRNHGCARVAGTKASYIVMSIEIFRDMMGVGSDEELAASLEAIDEGLADINAGRTRPFRDVLAELGSDAEV